MGNDILEMQKAFDEKDYINPPLENPSARFKRHCHRREGNAKKRNAMQGYILLHAIDPPRNIWRFYEVHLGKDLFGLLTTTVFYGRISPHIGTKKELLFAREEDQYKHILRLLYKRLKAQKRIGINYTVINHSSSMERLLNHMKQDIKKIDHIRIVRDSSPY